MKDFILTQSFSFPG